MLVMEVDSHASSKHTTAIESCDPLFLRCDDRLLDELSKLVDDLLVLGQQSKEEEEEATSVPNLCQNAVSRCHSHNQAQRRRS